MPQTEAKADDAIAAAVRSCLEDGCDTRLSMYNDYDYCALHQPMIIPRMRGKVL